MGPIQKEGAISYSRCRWLDDNEIAKRIARMICAIYFFLAWLQQTKVIIYLHRTRVWEQTHDICLYSVPIQRNRQPCLLLTEFVLNLPCLVSLTPWFNGWNIIINMHTPDPILTNFNEIIIAIIMTSLVMD